MDAAAVTTLLENHLPDCTFHVEGEGSHYNIEAIGEVFADLRPVKKQQLVYGALSEHIANGSIHAVNIRTYTPQQWEARS
jgi:acid stress-induced BolA-like protein IbaG/YrbA